LLPYHATTKGNKHNGEAQHVLVVAMQRRIERLEDAAARLTAAGAPPSWPPPGQRPQPPSA